MSSSTPSNTSDQRSPNSAFNISTSNTSMDMGIPIDEQINFFIRDVTPELSIDIAEAVTRKAPNGEDNSDIEMEDSTTTEADSKTSSFLSIKDLRSNRWKMRHRSKLVSLKSLCGNRPCPPLSARHSRPRPRPRPRPRHPPKLISSSGIQGRKAQSSKGLLKSTMSRRHYKERLTKQQEDMMMRAMDQLAIGEPEQTAVEDISEEWEDV
jgi:hypothetical protein